MQARTIPLVLGLLGAATACAGQSRSIDKDVAQINCSSGGSNCAHTRFRVVTQMTEGFDWKRATLEHARIENIQPDTIVFHPVGSSMLPERGALRDDVNPPLAFFVALFSSPNDFPNVPEPTSPTMGDPNDPNVVGPRLLSGSWYDSTIEPNAVFVMLQFTIEQHAAMPPLTLDVTNDVVAAVQGTMTSEGPGRIRATAAFDFDVYREPPANDDCTAALPVFAGDSVQGWLASATSDGNSSCGSSSASRDERLYLALVRRMKGEAPLPRADLEYFVLAEERKLGEYSGSFLKTDVPGVYHFLVRVEGITPECEPFQREHNFSVVVEKGDK